MQSSPILVLSSEIDPALFEALSRIGYATVYLRAPAQAVRRLRHESFSAVVIDAAPDGVDLLELVLTLRDFAQTVPVAVIRGADEDGDETTQALRYQQNMLLLSPRMARERVADEIDLLIRTEGAKAP